MSELMNAFNNSWPWVQSVMLLCAAIVVPGLILGSLYLLFRYLNDRRRLPDDILFAVRRTNDRLTIEIHKNASVSAALMTDLVRLASPQKHELDKPERD